MEPFFPIIIFNIRLWPSTGVFHLPFEKMAPRSSRSRTRSQTSRKIIVDKEDDFSSSARSSKVVYGRKPFNPNLAPPKSGSGMTIWWSFLSVFTLFLRFEQEIRFAIFAMNEIPRPLTSLFTDWLQSTSPSSCSSPLSLLRGISCVSALCVGTGYYTFKICFRQVQGSMARQLHYPYKDTFPMWVFYSLDICVHVIGCGVMYWCWWKYVDPVAGLGAFIYHRMWSLVHSRGETLYFCQVEHVYGFHHAMPVWSYILLYLSETIIVGFVMYRALYPNSVFNI